MRLSGGASRETWSFDLVDRRRAAAADPAADAAGTDGQLAAGIGMAIEAALLRAAARRGRAGGRRGRRRRRLACSAAPGMVVERLDGRDDRPQAAARRRVGDGARRGSARRSGRRWRRSTASPPMRSTGSRRPTRSTQYRDVLDALGEPHPAFELGFRWLEANRPGAQRAAGRPRRPAARQPARRSRRPPGGPRLGARPPRRSDGGPRVVLRAGVAVRLAAAGRRRRHPGGAGGGLRGGRRRAGRPRGAALVGDARHPQVGRDVHHAGLEPPERDVPLDGARHHRPAGVRERVGRARAAPRPAARAASPGRPRRRRRRVHDRPTMAELLEAVREWVDGDVRTGTEGRLSFHARVATNALRMLEREVALEPALSRGARRAAARRSGARPTPSWPRGSAPATSTTGSRRCGRSSPPASTTSSSSPTPAGWRS